MKKNTHPKLNKTTVILSNGSSYTKKWAFFRNYLKLDLDILKNNIWKNSNLDKKQIKK